MKINENRSARTVALALTLGVGLLGQTTFAQAQSAMAPPVSSGAPAQGQSVYQWSDVPVNQQVQITRAVFDQGGYQLYASTGETIVVPFANQNLYVMKFGQTSGGMYFVNDGSAPTLFIPPGGYIENAGAAGAHWYPFPQHFNYTQPVYEGIAPTWDAYVGMGWYPGMMYYGGYYGYHPWHLGLSFSPFPGLFFSIGGHPYYGWNSYHSYYYAHPYNRVYVRSYAPYRGYSVVHRGPSYFGSHAAFGHAAGYYNSHGSFAHGGGSFGHTAGAFGGRATVHGGAFGHASVGGHAFGGAAVHSGGAFGHAGGSFGHSPSGFGSGRASTPAFGHAGGSFSHGAPAGGSFGHGASTGGGSFGHSAPAGGGFGRGASGGGSFGHSAPSGGGSHGSFGGGGSHGSFGGGGSHGSSGGGGSHGSFGGGGSHSGGGHH